MDEQNTQQENNNNSTENTEQTTSPAPTTDPISTPIAEEKNDKSTPSNMNTEDITSDQIAQMKAEAVEAAKSYAKKGVQTRKEPSPDLANDQGPYNWWENQATYESNTWSISFWEYDNGSWQLQATRVELQQDGRSRMTAYSMRKDSDTKFPGFQVYREQSDDRYHPAEIEDVVYLNRVLKDLNEITK